MLKCNFYIISSEQNSVKFGMLAKRTPASVLASANRSSQFLKTLNWKYRDIRVYSIQTIEVVTIKLPTRQRFSTNFFFIKKLVENRPRKVLVHLHSFIFSLFKGGRQKNFTFLADMSMKFHVHAFQAFYDISTLHNPQNLHFLSGPPPP